MNRPLLSVLSSAAIAATALAGVSPADAAPPHKYKNCAQLHSKYPHGVGRPGAHDRVRGHSKPVTDFARNAKVYKVNKGSDRDHDGIACEQH